MEYYISYCSEKRLGNERKICKIYVGKIRYGFPVKIHKLYRDYSAGYFTVPRAICLYCRTCAAGDQLFPYFFPQYQQAVSGKREISGGNPEDPAEIFRDETSYAAKPLLPLLPLPAVQAENACSKRERQNMYHMSEMQE